MTEGVQWKADATWPIVLTVLVASLFVAPAALADVSCVQSDGGSGHDAGFGEGPDPDPPVTITAGDYSGCLDGADPEDLFLLSVAEGDVVYIEADGSQCDETYLWVFLDGEAVAHYQPFWSDCKLARAGVHVPVNGTLEIVVASYQYGDALLVYDLSVSVNEVSPVCGVTQDDAGSGGDADEANPITLVSPTAGCVDLFDGVDRYTLLVEPGLRYHFRLEAPDCSTYAIGIRYADGSLEGGMSARVCSDEQTRSVTFSEPAIVTVSVHRWDGEGAYSLSFGTCTERIPSESPRLVTSRLYGVECAMDDLGA